MPGYAYRVVAFLSPAAIPAISPHQSTFWEGICEQLPVAPGLRFHHQFDSRREHSRCVPEVPLVFDLDDREESECRQLLALRPLRGDLE